MLIRLADGNQKPSLFFKNNSPLSIQQISNVITIRITAGTIPLDIKVLKTSSHTTRGTLPNSYIISLPSSDITVTVT